VHENAALLETEISKTDHTAVLDSEPMFHSGAIQYVSFSTARVRDTTTAPGDQTVNQHLPLWKW
jgi:hypothetical protein